MSRPSWRSTVRTRRRGKSFAHPSKIHGPLPAPWTRSREAATRSDIGELWHPLPSRALMGRALRLTAALGAALVFCAPAFAKTDGPAQLAFTWPADGTVTGWFGELRGSHVHTGVDIGILRSLEVRAAAPGLVTAVGTPVGYDGYGK